MKSVCALCCAVLGILIVFSDAAPRQHLIQPGQQLLDGPPTAAAAPARRLLVEVTTGNQNATLTVDGRLVWWRPVVPVRPRAHDPRGLEQRGLLVLVLHPVTGRVMHEGCSSGWMEMDTGHAFRRLIQDTHGTAVLIFLTLGEVGPSIDRVPETVNFMKRMGARHYHQLQLEDRYVLVRRKDGAVYSEAFVTNAKMRDGVAENQVALHVGSSIPAFKPRDILCPWTKSRQNIARAKFCYNYGGYGALCECEHDNLLPLMSQELRQNNLTAVPIAIVASNRPRALWRTLNSLLTNRGVVRSNVIVFVDGEFEEVDRLCALLQVRCVCTASDLTDTTLRIREHYKQIMTEVWELYPNASRAIFLEEDLQVSPDFVSYFSQTSHLLDADSSLWCVSAWNDNGYDVSSSDPALLYRVEYMPGLGWMMSRNNVKALLDKWPVEGDHAYDWDVWVRWDSNRLGRECVIPDVSRTYHFGITGLHLTGTFHTMYYVDHALNSLPDVQLRDVDSLLKRPYEDHLKQMMKEALPIHPSDFIIDGDLDNGGECRVNITGTESIYTVFFNMQSWEDTHMYKSLAKCFLIWDLDVRGHHHGLWRFTYFDNHVLMFGVPITMYMNEAMEYLKHPIEVINDLRTE